MNYAGYAEKLTLTRYVIKTKEKSQRHAELALLPADRTILQLNFIIYNELGGKNHEKQRFKPGLRNI